MNIKTTATCITLEEGPENFLLLEKLLIPDYQNVTARPYITFYYKEGETIWDHFCLCMERLAVFCPDDPYLGCYALVFRRLYTLLLSGSQAKNVIAYGLAPDCGAYKVYQDFMTFLQEGNALTALARSPYSFTALTRNACSALLYCLDTCPALTAVCDAMEKVKYGGLILFYTLHGDLPSELAPLLDRAERDSFGHCTVYALTMNEVLSEFAGTNGSENVVLSRAEEVLKRADDLQNLTQAMLAGTSLPEDTYTLTAVILQQSEEILLSIYDYLENDELPVLANVLKEAVLNYYVGVSGGYDLTAYRQKLSQASETFFAAIEQEFQ